MYNIYDVCTFVINDTDNDADLMKAGSRCRYNINDTFSKIVMKGKDNNHICMHFVHHKTKLLLTIFRLCLY